VIGARLEDAHTPADMGADCGLLASVDGALEWPFCALAVLLAWRANHMPGCWEKQ
jgi:hypothetical protein